MKVHSPAKAGERAHRGAGRATLSSPLKLQRRYEEATASLNQYFSLIDAWLGEHYPDLWRQIHAEDDELFRLRQLGVSESRFQTKLEEFLTLCQQAEQLYCEAHPDALRLPPLAEDERVAVYYAFADGVLRKATEYDE